MLLAALLMTGCDASNPQFGSVQVESIDADPDGTVTVEWSRYAGDQFAGYQVYREVRGTGLVPVARLAEVERTAWTETVPGYIGGTLRYRVDVALRDSAVRTGRPGELRTPLPVFVTAGITDSTQGLTTLAWRATDIPGQFREYRLQIRDTGSGSDFSTEAVFDAPQDTSLQFLERFGDDPEDYRLLAVPDTGDVIESVALEVGFGKLFPPHDRSRFASEEDAHYLVQRETFNTPAYTLRVANESFETTDSIGVYTEIIPGTTSIADFASNVQEIRRFNPDLTVAETFDTAALPNYSSASASPGSNPALLPGDRVVYEDTNGDVVVYDFETGSVVGTISNTEIINYSQTGRYVAVEAGADLDIYDVTGSSVDFLRRVDTNIERFNWHELADGTDVYLQLAGSAVDVRRTDDGTRVGSFLVSSQSDTVISDDTAGGLVGLLNGSTQMTLYTLDGTQVRTIALNGGNPFDYTLRGGALLDNDGHAVSLGL